MISPSHGDTVLRRTRHAMTRRIAAWGPEGGDAVLYALSAVFAALTAALSGLDLYREWGLMAVGPYVVGAMASVALVRWRRRRREGAAERSGRRARAGILVLVLVGATILPLALQVALRSDGRPGHVQPEGPVIEQAAQRLTSGKDPYRLVVRKDGRIDNTTPGQPVYESFFPYLPLMTVFGLPASTREPIRLTDARIFFSLTTLVVVGGSLVLSRAPTGRRIRAFQFLSLLPTAALPLATGGDDMPIVAFLLLAMVLAQRRRPGWSGLVLGIVSAMKFTAWPLAALALFAARRPDGRRAPGRMLLGMLVVAGPAVVPFVLRGPGAFLENVVLFPLGLVGVASPAASALPGHELVTLLPSLHHVLPLTVAIVGGALLASRLRRRPPGSVAEVTALAGWVMTVAILLAPATRVGYLLYPINFFVWSWMLTAPERAARKKSEVPATPEVELAASAAA